MHEPFHLELFVVVLLEMFIFLIRADILSLPENRVGKKIYLHRQWSVCTEYLSASEYACEKI